jgi:hypothetical protein
MDGFVSNDVWEPIATLVLDAAYEATLWAGVINAAKTGVKDVFLTFLGGGVFGNPPDWITNAIARAVAVLESEGASLTVNICHYRSVSAGRAEQIHRAVRAWRTRVAGSSDVAVATGAGAGAGSITFGGKSPASGSITFGGKSPASGSITFGGKSPASGSITFGGTRAAPSTSGPSASAPASAPPITLSSAPGDPYSYPYPRSWWIVPGQVLGSGFPGTQDMEETMDKLSSLVAMGVRLIVNLQEVDEAGAGGMPFPDYVPLLEAVCSQVKRPAPRVVRLPIQDYGIPTRQRMREILDEVLGAQKRGETVLVHCWGGHGRTGTVAGCLLRELEVGLTGEEALGRIAKARAHDEYLAEKRAPQTPAQMDFVRTWV